MRDFQGPPPSNYITNIIYVNFLVLLCLMTHACFVDTVEFTWFRYV